MTPLIRAPQWLPRLAPPLQIQVPVCTLGPQTFTTIQSICPIIHRPIQLHDKIIQPNQLNTAIPVYQRPPDYYTVNRRKNQSVDFKNLILLTKSGMRARRSQLKPSEHGNLTVESSRSNLPDDHHPAQFGERRPYTRPKPPATSNSVVRDIYNSEGQLEADTGESTLDHDNDEDKAMAMAMGIRR